MATNVTLTELITRVRERADQENSGFCSDSEITHYINDAIFDLYAKMVNVDDGKLFATVSPTLTKIGNNAYQLPSNFMRLVDVNIYTGSRWVPAYEADSQDYLNLLSRQYAGDYDVRYFLQLNQEQGRYELFLFPAKAVANVGVRYIKEAPRLTLGTDTLKWPSNWHEAVVVSAAIKCLEKEESETEHLHFHRDKAEDRVLKDIRSQAVAQIETLRDVAGRNRRRRRGGRNWGF
jgi:hypothetical protein